MPADVDKSEVIQNKMPFISQCSDYAVMAQMPDALLQACPVALAKHGRKRDSDTICH